MDKTHQPSPGPSLSSVTTETAGFLSKRHLRMTKIMKHKSRGVTGPPKTAFNTLPQGAEAWQAILARREQMLSSTTPLGQQQIKNENPNRIGPEDVTSQPWPKPQVTCPTWLGMWEPADLSSSKVMGNPRLPITDKGGEKGATGSAPLGPLRPPFPGSLQPEDEVRAGGQPGVTTRGHGLGSRPGVTVWGGRAAGSPLTQVPLHCLHLWASPSQSSPRPTVGNASSQPPRQSQTSERKDLSYSIKRSYS